MRTMVLGRIMCLLALCGLCSCSSEQQRREADKARLRKERLLKAKMKNLAEKRRQLDAQQRARMQPGVMEVVVPGDPRSSGLTDEKPGRRRNRFTFPSHTRVVGGLSRRSVSRVLRRGKYKIKKCIRKGWKAKPPLRGTVRLAFAVGRAGQVTRISVEYGRPPHTVTTECVRGAVKRWKFPQNRREPTLVGVSVVGRRRFRRRYWRGWR